MNATSPFSRLLILPVVAALTGAATVSLVGCSDTSGTSVTAADEALWCKEHGVEEKYCVLCHPEILESSDLLLCPEHGKIPEEICTACHPELKDKYKSCPHDLPTAFCPKCSPEFAAFLEDHNIEAHGEHGHEHHDGEEHDHDHDHEHEKDDHQDQEKVQS